MISCQSESDKTQDFVSWWLKRQAEVHLWLTLVPIQRGQHLFL